MWFLRYTENRKNTGNDVLKGYRKGNAEQEVLECDETFTILYASLLMTEYPTGAKI